MKNLFIMLLLSMASLQVFAHENEAVNNTSENTKSETVVKDKGCCDIHVNSQSGREYGYCSCGGKLHFTAKAIATVKECTLCHGKGIYYGETCTLCHGSGSITYWQSGYVCERCHSVYDSL